VSVLNISVHLGLAHLKLDGILTTHPL